MSETVVKSAGSGRYEPATMDQKWRARWEADNLYRADDFSRQPKHYALSMFPYTSGDLHIGHWYNYALADAHARFMRMRGFNVMQPIGFDAFGLPAEGAAIKNKIHPRIWTLDNIARMSSQLKTIGATLDWSRELATCLPDYYKWTQWFFLKFLEQGLAYRAMAVANWCPSCQTVLANEQVVDGGCDRCGTPVIKKDLEQWFFRITKYADELLQFDTVDWPERVRVQQTNWIGRSEGARLVFGVEGHPDESIPVFTTRPDTVYGATFMVLAPEHPLVEVLTAPDRREEVSAYVEAARRESEIERLAADKEKSGVPIGANAINPFNGQPIPIWIGDYVLATYGTGAVMGVPGHDQRDFDFARKFGLPIPVVIAPPDWDGQPLEAAYTEPGTMVNSGPFDGTPSDAGKKATAEHARDGGFGEPTVNYRLRDWLISRQRYWGVPIPVVYCERDGIVPLREEDLPVLLPDDSEFLPTGQSPLLYDERFLNTTCPQCGGPAKRETDTLDTFVDSSWYFLRFCDANNAAEPFDPARVKYWSPVDMYTGGIEHAILHLLYARFFTKALRDMGMLEFGEPFKRLFNQGIILGADHEKMSKSRGNVVNPDDYVHTRGADCVRMFLMFIGPWDQGGTWNDHGIEGIWRFLNRVWALALEAPEGETRPHTPADERQLRRVTHQTIRKATQDIDAFKYNTMVAALMEFQNHLTSVRGTTLWGTPAWDEAIDALVRLLAPSAPHMAEEIWERMGNRYSVHTQAWPAWSEELAKDESIELPVQVNGKVRDKIVVAAEASEAEIVAAARASERVGQFLAGREPKKVLVVPKRLVSIVV